MKSVWKFPLPLGNSDLPLPSGAIPLTLQFQDSIGMPCLWALVDPLAPLVTWNIVMLGTGRPTADASVVTKENYLGTIQIRDYVWHFFGRQA
jgi:hypothetical protein